MKIEVQRSGGETALSVGGRLTASGAGSLRDALLAACTGSERVVVALRDVEEADLTFLQLVCAAHRTAAARSIAFVVTGMEGAPPVARIVRDAGAAPAGNCPPGCPLRHAADGADAAAGVGRPAP